MKQETKLVSRRACQIAIESLMCFVIELSVVQEANDKNVASKLIIIILEFVYVYL